MSNSGDYGGMTGKALFGADVSADDVKKYRDVIADTIHILHVINDMALHDGMTSGTHTINMQKAAKRADDRLTLSSDITLSEYSGKAFLETLFSVAPDKISLALHILKAAEKARIYNHETYYDEAITEIITTMQDFARSESYKGLSQQSLPSNVAKVIQQCQNSKTLESFIDTELTPLQNVLSELANQLENRDNTTTYNAISSTNGRNASSAIHTPTHDNTTPRGPHPFKVATDAIASTFTDEQRANLSVHVASTGKIVPYNSAISRNYSSSSDCSLVFTDNNGSSHTIATLSRKTESDVAIELKPINTPGFAWTTPILDALKTSLFSIQTPQVNAPITSHIGMNEQTKTPTINSHVQIAAEQEVKSESVQRSIRNSVKGFASKLGSAIEAGVKAVFGSADPALSK